jgi:hypothetical protein
MDGRGVLLSLALVAAIGGCDSPGGASAEPEALEELERARAKAQAARYLLVVDDLGARDGRRVRQRLEFAPGLTAISENGRVLLWESRDVSYSLNRRRRCYERSTQFERGDLVEVRRDVVVPRALVSRAELVGLRLIRWRGPESERGYRVEGTLRLDPAGRPRLKRERITWAGTRPPGRAYQRRYSYPHELDPGPAPRPRC